MQRLRLRAPCRRSPWQTICLPFFRQDRHMANLLDSVESEGQSRGLASWILPPWRHHPVRRRPLASARPSWAGLGTVRQAWACRGGCPRVSRVQLQITCSDDRLQTTICDIFCATRILLNRSQPLQNSPHPSRRPPMVLTLQLASKAPTLANFQGQRLLQLALAGCSFWGSGSQIIIY